MRQIFAILCANAAVAGLAAALWGCAARPQPAAAPWGEPRPSDRRSGAADFESEAEAKAAQATVEEPTGALSLRRALALALARNPELAAFSWEERVGEARVLQAGLRPNPSVEAGVENVLGTGDFVGGREAETTLQLSQLIQLGGKRAKAVGAAKLSRDLAVWDYESARLDVVTRTAQAFIETLSLQERLEIADETVRLAREVVRAVSDRVEAARTLAAEQTRAEVALAAAEIEKDQTQRALDAARQRLASNWGSAQPRFERAEGDLETLSDVPPLDRLLERLERNPELARWATEREQRRARLELEKSRAIPDITVSAGYRRFSGPEDNAAVAAVSIPLPLFHRNEGAIKEAEYRFRQADDEERAAELRVTTELGQAWQRFSAARAEVEAVKAKVLPGARETFDAMSRYYREGRLSYVDVLDAQRTLFAARAQYIRALSDFHKARISIERIIGEPLDSD